VAALNKPVPVSRPLLFPLSTTDTVFSYKLKIEDKIAECDAQNDTLSCAVHTLDLVQGKNYTFELVREFNNIEIGTVINKNVPTLSATTITNSSIVKGGTVFTKAKTIDLEFDKTVAKASTELYRIEGDKRIKISTNSVNNDEKLSIVIAEELPRSAAYELIVDKVEATDGSSLEDPYTLSFSTSGGPKVTGINVGTTGVALGARVVVSFDQPLSEKQDISKVVTTTGGASVVSKSGNQVIIATADVPKCGDFSIKITNDVQSNYDIAGNSAWGYSGRTICHSISTIGSSFRGRPINAYYFGQGPVAVVYTGAIHGNEASTKYLMDKWIQDLEANARNIPANKTIIVIPQLNPDGFASGSRTNARNIDLNRNFATSDWQKDITTVNNQPFPGGGGEAPASEPEAQVIAAFIQRMRPALVLSYHSIGGVLAANQAGSSNAWAATYSQLTGYSNVTGNSGETFQYSISGTADDWYAERLGVPSILIELSSHSNHQFDRNKKAMWTMAGI
jgi:protein MpaA